MRYRWNFYSHEASVHPSALDVILNQDKYLTSCNATLLNKHIGLQVVLFLWWSEQNRKKIQTRTRCLFMCVAAVNDSSLRTLVSFTFNYSKFLIFLVTGFVWHVNFISGVTHVFISNPGDMMEVNRNITIKMRMQKNLLQSDPEPALMPHPDLNKRTLSVPGNVTRM